VSGRVVTMRRAEPDDVDFVVELTMHDDVRPYLSARRATTRAEILDEIKRSTEDPHRFGRFIVEADGERAGAMGFRLENERSRIAALGGLAIHPAHRGHHLADAAARLLQRHLIFELGYHRLQLEIYGFNDRALQHAERSGFTREGVRRKAYWRHGEWVDGVLFGLIREDLEPANEEVVVQEEPRIQSTEQEWDEERGDNAPGMTESPPEGEPKEERAEND
jgi:RimJ/RimL family protein N-acetyltransferase